MIDGKKRGAETGEGFGFLSLLRDVTDHSSVDVWSIFFFNIISHFSNPPDRKPASPGCSYGDG